MNKDHSNFMFDELYIRYFLTNGCLGAVLVNLYYLGNVTMLMLKYNCGYEVM